MKQTQMYVCTLVKFIRWSALLDVQVGTEDIEWNYIALLYNRNKGWAQVRIALRWQLTQAALIELQWHEKLSYEWTNVWSVIPVFGRA